MVMFQSDTDKIFVDTPIMRTIRSYYLFALLIATLSFTGACKKNSMDSGACYIPTSSDTTANATLSELQQGRTLYIANCNKCHGLYSPDNYSPTQWKSILSSMTPNTGMTSSQIQLVTKYVCKGHQ